ncbi:MAG: thiolase family protein [Trueperaceae bacterium]|nr:thiolase family protein [Trueperaceae bacterium]
MPRKSASGRGAAKTSPRTVIVGSARTPFSRAGSDYQRFVGYDLARFAISGALARSGVDPAAVQQVVMGNVVQNSANANVARDAALAAGAPLSAPAHSVSMACISANRAISDVAAAVAAGGVDLAVAGGVEMLGDVPVGFSREVRRRLFASRRYRSPLEWRAFFKGLPLSELLPKAPPIAEFTTGETMGSSADRLAAKFGVSREEQDAFALRSHQLAAQAQREGRLGEQVVPVVVPGGRVIQADNGVREDSSAEKLAALSPAFVKPFGTVTAGNASPLTDGAAAVVLASEEYAQAHGLTARARIVDFCFVAQDPQDELLLGPAYAVPKLLTRNGLSLADIDVIEIHEAFAGQVLAVLNALASESFGRERLRLEGAYGSVDLERVNRWGGSISLGHPFGATGARLVATAVDRLAHEDGTLAVVTACAAGGLGHAMLIERLPGAAA